MSRMVFSVGRLEPDGHRGQAGKVSGGHRLRLHRAQTVVLPEDLSPRPCLWPVSTGGSHHDIVAPVTDPPILSGGDDDGIDTRGNTAPDDTRDRTVYAQKGSLGVGAGSGRPVVERFGVFVDDLLGRLQVLMF